MDMFNRELTLKSWHFLNVKKLRFNLVFAQTKGIWHIINESRGQKGKRNAIEKMGTRHFRMV